MQNEFEKQVQQKLEELKLVPSEPVWQKVEMQIRQGKDRRRIFFWLPFAVLLTGGGIWLSVDNSSKTFSDNSRSRNEVKSPVVTSKELTNETIGKENSYNKPNAFEHKKPAVRLEPGETSRKLTNASKPEVAYSSNTKTGVSKKLVSRKAGSKKISPVAKEESVPGNGKETLIANDNPGQPSSEIITSINKTTPINTTTTENPLVKNNDTITIKGEDEKSKTLTQSQDTVKQDTLSLKKMALRKSKQNKWKYAVEVNGGLSGEGRLNVFNGMKSLDALYYSAPNNNSVPNAPVLYGPSQITKGLSVSIGGAAIKQLGQRTSFSAGLQYGFFSNSILVGNRVSQSAVFRDYAVSSYYSNTAFTNPTSSPYHNKYHFISLPFSIDWQVARRLPLKFHIGVSPQYLVQTNALVFDYSRQAYFHNKKAFNRLQLFTQSGFSYSIAVKKSTIEIGPELQYGLSRLEKDNSQYHLVSYGLKAQLQFNRK